MFHELEQGLTTPLGLEPSIGLNLASPHPLLLLLLASERYKEANKEAKRVVREAKERDGIRWGEQLQRNFLENKRAFWKKVKAKGGVRVDVEIESKDGSMLSQTNEVKCRWREHFSELLGGEQVEEGIMGDELSREKIEGRSGMLHEEITEEEIRRGVGKLKKGKAERVYVVSQESYLKLEEK